MRNLRRNLSVFVLLALVSPVTLAFAGSAGGHHQASISDLFYPTANFLMFLAVLFFALKEPFVKAVRARREGIASSVSAATTKQSEAEQRLKIAKAQIAGVRAESESIRLRDIEDAKREVEVIKSSAQAKAKRILEQAQSTAKSEGKAMGESVRRQLAEQIIQRATERLAREFNESADRELRKSAVDGIGALRN